MLLESILKETFSSAGEKNRYTNQATTVEEE